MVESLKVTAGSRRDAAEAPAAKVMADPGSRKGAADRVQRSNMTPSGWRSRRATDAERKGTSKKIARKRRRARTQKHLSSRLRLTCLASSENSSTGTSKTRS